MLSVRNSDQRYSLNAQRKHRDQNTHNSVAICHIFRISIQMLWNNPNETAMLLAKLWVQTHIFS